MQNSWKKISRKFLSYQRSDRNAIIILGALILLSILINILLVNRSPESNADFSEIKRLIEEWENTGQESKETQILFSFDPNHISKQKLDSLSIPDRVKRNMLSYREAGGKYKTAADLRNIYGMNDSVFALLKSFIRIKTEKVIINPPGTNHHNKPAYFNPNQASGDELKLYGFTTFQANNLLAYRKKGGRFRQAADLLKIYGIDSAFYKSIEDHIKIEMTAEKVASVSAVEIRIELNTADSAKLVKLRGVGPVYAKRIINYRNLLGGFYSKDQLKEVYDFPEETFLGIQDHIYVDTLKLLKLRINFLEFPELLKHPYLDINDVKLIVNTRESSGAFKNISEVKMIKGFDSETFSKISPYITCR